MPDKLDDLVKAGKPVKLDDLYRTVVSVYPQAAGKDAFATLQAVGKDRPQLQQLQIIFPKDFASQHQIQASAPGNPQGPPPPSKPQSSLWTSIEKGIAASEAGARNIDKTIQDIGLSLLDKSGVMKAAEKAAGRTGDQHSVDRRLTELRKIYASRGPEHYAKIDASLPEPQGILQNAAEMIPEAIGGSLPYIAAGETFLGAPTGMAIAGGLAGYQGSDLGDKGVAGSVEGALENLALATVNRIPGTKALSKSTSKTFGSILKRFGSQNFQTNVDRWVAKTVADINARGMGKVGTGATITTTTMLPKVYQALKTGDWSQIPKQFAQSLAQGLSIGLTARSNRGADTAQPVGSAGAPSGGTPPAEPPELPGIRDEVGPQATDEVAVKGPPILPKVPGFPEGPLTNTNRIEALRRLGDATKRQELYQTQQSEATKAFDEARDELRKRELELSRAENHPQSQDAKALEEKRKSVEQQKQHVEGFQERLNQIDANRSSVEAELRNLRSITTAQGQPAASRARAQGLDPNAPKPQDRGPNPPIIKTPKPPPDPNAPQVSKFTGFGSLLKQGGNFRAGDIPGVDLKAHGINPDDQLVFLRQTPVNQADPSMTFRTSDGRLLKIGVTVVSGKPSPGKVTVLGGSSGTKPTNIPQNPTSNPPAIPPAPPSNSQTPPSNPPTQPPAPTTGPTTPPAGPSPSPSSGGGSSPAPAGPRPSAPAATVNAPPQVRPQFDLDNLTEVSPASPKAAEDALKARYSRMNPAKIAEVVRDQSQPLEDRKDSFKILQDMARLGIIQPGDLPPEPTDPTPNSGGDGSPSGSSGGGGSPSPAPAPPTAPPAETTAPPAATPNTPAVAAEVPNQQASPSVKADKWQKGDIVTVDGKEWIIRDTDINGNVVLWDGNEMRFTPTSKLPTRPDVVKAVNNQPGMGQFPLHPDKLREVLQRILDDPKSSQLKKDIVQKQLSALPSPRQAEAKTRTDLDRVKSQLEEIERLKQENEELKAQTNPVQEPPKPVGPPSTPSADELRKAFASKAPAPAAKPSAKSPKVAANKPSTTPAPAASTSGQPEAEALARPPKDHYETIARVVGSAKAAGSAVKKATLIVLNNKGNPIASREFNPSGIKSRAAIDDLAQILNTTGAARVRVEWNDSSGKVAKSETTISGMDAQELKNVEKKSDIKAAEPPKPTKTFGDVAEELFPGRPIGDLTEEEDQQIIDKLDEYIQNNTKTDKPKV